MKKLTFLLIFVAALNLSCDDTSAVKTFNIGEYKFYLLSDLTGAFNQDLLVGASDDMLKKYLPKGTFPIAVNCFAVRTPEKTVLIDSGTGSALLGNLAKVKITPSEIDAVLITHMHYDHIGGLLKDGKPVFPNADIYIAQAEQKYWTNEKEMAKAAEAARSNFQLAIDVVKAYGSKVKPFTPNELGQNKTKFFGGITPIAAYGHTPGHTVYLIESNSEKLMVWGDLVHAMVIQMPNPDVALKFDTDNKTAIAVRKKILKYISDNKISVAGMHIVPPGSGTIAASDQGYSFTPFK